MPFMHKSTFEIIQGSNIDNYLDDYFEVDELIALPIQALNQNGYTTTFCCSGHPFSEIGERLHHLKQRILNLLFQELLQSKT